VNERLSQFQKRLKMKIQWRSPFLGINDKITYMGVEIRKPQLNKSRNLNSEMQVSNRSMNLKPAKGKSNKPILDQSLIKLDFRKKKADIAEGVKSSIDTEFLISEWQGYSHDQIKNRSGVIQQSRLYGQTIN